MAKRGITVEQMAGAPLTDEQQRVTPCYIGQAPIWHIDSPNWKKLAGSVLLINSIKEMRQAVGYYAPDTGAWEKEFSLCEPVTLHADENAFPIILLVNTSVPAEREETYTGTAKFSGGIAEIKEGNTGEGTPQVRINGKAILNSVEIAGKTKGEDYKVKYSDNGQFIMIEDLLGAKMTEETVTYKMISDVSFSSVTFEEMDFFEQMVGIVPDFFGAPGWYGEKMENGTTVAEALIKAVEETLNGHWYTDAYIQLEADTREAAAEEREKYTSYRAKLVFPYALKGGRIYSAAAWWMCKRQQVCNRNDTIPYMSESNEETGIERLCTRSGTIIRQKESHANGLNAIGIATFNFVTNAWRTWGVCMANYKDAYVEQGIIDADKLNDVAVRMKDHVSNLFQLRYTNLVDKPMSKRDCNSIVQDFGSVLNAYVTSGMLIYAAVEFLESENSTSAMADGNFVFTIREANTPPGKSITGKVYYSAEALENSYKEE